MISIVLPSYNSTQYIGRTIKSIAQQSYPEIELIIIDDCSTDDSLRVIKKSLEQTLLDYRVITLSKNKGQGYCRNLGISYSRGEFIAFIDSDDCWHPNKLEQQLKFAEKNNYSFTYTNIILINEDDKPIGNSRILPRNVNANSILISNHIATSSVLLRRSIAIKYNFPDLRVKQDFVYWYNILLYERIEAQNVNLPLTYYRKHQKQTTRKKYNLLTIHFKVLYFYLKLNFFKSLFYTITYSLHGFYKHFIKL